MNTQQKLERVAIALCPWRDGRLDSREAEKVWSELPSHFKDAYRAQAKAAIAAIAPNEVDDESIIETILARTKCTRDQAVDVADVLAPYLHPKREAEPKP